MHLETTKMTTSCDVIVDENASSTWDEQKLEKQVILLMKKKKTKIKNKKSRCL